MSTTSLGAAIDQRLQDALASAHYRTTLNNQKQTARLKLKNDRIFSIAGGTFHATPDLIAFVKTLIDLGHTEAILLDINENPIKIVDLQEFLEQLVDTYVETTNEFAATVTIINRSRTTKAVVGEV